MGIKSLVRHLKFLTLVIVYDEIYARENASIYCNKSAGVDMQNDAVAEVKQYITC